MKDNRATYLLLAFLLLLASVLRLVHPFSMPFLFDEMSAIMRTHYSSLGEEIRQGVMLRDTHPAGVQVFLYYWTKLFGYSEIAVKLPFIFCGILSVYYIFRLGNEWFSPTTGLVCATYLATIEYTILYTQVARPYATGLLFSLVMVWHWYNFVFKPESNYYKNMALYVLFSVLCAYNHHFSLLFAAIVGLTGLFFVRGKYLLKYILAGTGIFILYIPHLHIFFHQLKEQGVEEWLAKPDKAYMFKYIEYILQYSVIAYIIASFLFLLGIVTMLRKRTISSPYYFISLSWFLIPFLIGFFYSKYVNAVLQYSVLIFSFPFMLFSFFGLLPNLNLKIRGVIILAICSVNVFVLVNGRKYYDIFYHLHYEQQVIINDSIYNKAGGSHFTALAIAAPDSIMEFYIQKHHSKVAYTWLPDSGDAKLLIKFLENDKAPFLTYDYTTISNPVYLPIILNYYPYLVLSKNQQGGTNFIFSSLPTNGKRAYIFQSENDFEKKQDYWGEADKSFLSDTIAYNGMHSYKMDSLHEWGPGFTCSLDKMTTNRYNIILVSVALYPLEGLKGVKIVCSLESEGNQLFWSGAEVNDFIPEDSVRRWVKAYQIIKLPTDCPVNPETKVHIYIWNNGKRNFYMDDFNVRTMEGNPIIYGLNERIGK